MTQPWEDPVTYVSIAAAEQAITDRGYVRDTQRSVWRNGETGKKAKVVHSPDDNHLFLVQWG